VVGRDKPPATAGGSDELMILSIGIDIVEVYRIRETLARTPRFRERVFTPGEQAYCESKGVAAAQSYAARFAAKEAFLKALKTGWRGKITWHDIEVVVDKDGAPELIVTGEAAQILNTHGPVRIHISISHTTDHAVAQVVLESS
jgi:holo-[acyl-carrier protein] synthase